VSDHHNQLSKVSLAGLLVTLGIIYGDIKYVIITLRADNNGEGGIFSLYALIRRRKPFLIFPAMIGGCALLADGIITPPVSVSSAIEGLLILNKNIPTIPIVITIITTLFLIQRVGTSIVGKAFGPLMFIWFSMLAILGLKWAIQIPTIFHSLNPYYAYNLLANYPEGYWLLGAVFLCTTGAEALYSDLGHCGKQNIRVSWMFVKTTLLLNYMGQGAWLLQFEGKVFHELNPFFGLMPQWFLLPGIIIATLAAIIASQALISGSFTLISEAIRLNVWPKVRIKYPTEAKGQLYVPSANWMLWAGCIGIVLYFEESAKMEAAYGLAITIAMLMTTVLLSNYLRKVKTPRVLVGLLLAVYLPIELSFLLANLRKFEHGGWVTLVISLLFIFIMWVWFKGRKIKNRLTEFVKLRDYIPILQQLSNDTSIPKYATHLVYLTSADSLMEVETKVIYSILQKQPKRADIYWFVHIHVDDKPYTMEYKVDHIASQDIVKIEFRLGFRVEQKINFYFRKVVEELMKNHEVDVTSRYASLSKLNITGDFRFVVLKRHLSYENELSVYEGLLMDAYSVLDSLSLSEEKAFGLDTSSVTVEKVPMVISPAKEFRLKRVYK